MLYDIYICKLLLFEDHLLTISLVGKDRGTAAFVNELRHYEVCRQILPGIHIQPFKLL